MLEVLRRFDRDGVPITFVGVAAAASVSRPWLYREPQLRGEILRHRSTATRPPTPLVPVAQRASAQSQHQKITVLNESSARANRNVPASVLSSDAPSASSAWLQQGREPRDTLLPSVTCHRRR